MNKIKIISGLLALELVYTLIKIVPSLLNTFDISQPASYAFLIFILILFLASVIGIYFEKKWAIISLWIYILLPLFVGFSVFVNFVGGYYVIIINVIIATYLSVHWNKFGKNNNVQ